MWTCFIGDELVAGVNDPRGLGRVGRVNVHSTFGLPATFLTLTVPSETTKQMATRWEAKVLPRLVEGKPHDLVIGVGPGSVAADILTARFRLNLVSITGWAIVLDIPNSVVGPPLLTGMGSGSLKALPSSHSEVRARRGVPFVDCYTPLIAHDQWFENMATSLVQGVDGQTLSNQAGYALMAWIVQHQGRYGWTGATLAGVQYPGMCSNNPCAPSTGSESTLPKENMEATYQVLRNGPVPVGPSAEGSGPTFPYGIPTPRTEDEKLVETPPPHVFEVHTDSEPAAPVPCVTSSSTAAQRDCSSSPTAVRFHATSTGTDPQDNPTPEDKFMEASIPPMSTHVFAGLASAIAVLFFASIGIAQANNLGIAALQWQFAAYLFGLIAMGLYIPFIPATVHYMRILFTEGGNESAETWMSGYTLICLVGLTVTVTSISDAVPVVRDLIEGPYATTVPSC